MKILIREARIKRGLTLNDLSLLSGISIKQLSKIENNLVDMRLSTLCAIADALCVSPEELFFHHGHWWESD